LPLLGRGEAAACGVGAAVSERKAASACGVGGSALAALEPPALPAVRGALHGGGVPGTADIGLGTMRSPIYPIRISRSGGVSRSSSLTLSR
jgi:hypothetical protein